LIELARQRRISPDMQAGGIATVSNFGVFKMEWGTPIPLPDQTLLLGLGMGKKVPSWDETKNEFVPKTEAQITLSFDHRSVDGGGASRLLKRVIELLQISETTLNATISITNQEQDSVPLEEE